MLSLYRQDNRGNYLPVSNFNVHRNERLKIQLESGARWLATVSYSLTGIDLNPIQRNLGTDRIIAPGYNRSSSKEFIAPSKPGGYMITANWKVMRGWPVGILVNEQESITINVSDDASSIKSIQKPSTGSTILTGLKTSAFIVWGILALIVAKEIRK